MNTPGEVPDLLDTLKRIERQATSALDRIHSGVAKNGVSALATIKNEAADARRRAGAKEEVAR